MTAPDTYIYIFIFFPHLQSGIPEPSLSWQQLSRGGDELQFDKGESPPTGGKVSGVCSTLWFSCIL